MICYLRRIVFFSYKNLKKEAEKMRKLPQLVPISYRDADNGISLKCYADTIVYLRENNKRILTAVRFGGYPEQVRGMSDAINGGISVETEIEQNRVIPRESVIEKNYHTTVFMPNQ